MMQRQQQELESDRNDMRAQAFTLEAIMASLVVLGSLVFALQVSGVTSLTVSTSNQQIVDQQGSVAAGVLDVAAADESLRPTLLYWDSENAEFYKTSEGGETFYTVGPPTAFGGLLNETLSDRNLAYNVNLYSVDNKTGTINRTRLVRSGQPSDDAARATRLVTVYDDDTLLFPNGSRTDTTLENTSFYAHDRYPEGPVYNVIRVEVVVWRI